MTRALDAFLESNRTLVVLQAQIEHHERPTGVNCANKGVVK